VTDGVAAKVGSPTPTIHVRLEVSPPDAKVEIDGRLVMDREVVVDPDRELHIVARAPGYQTIRVTRRASASGALSLQLTRQKPNTGAKKAENLVEDKW